MTRGKGGTIPWVPDYYGRCQILLGVPKILNNFTSTFFNTVYFLLKELSFEHGGAKLASCPRCHLTSLLPCASLNPTHTYLHDNHVSLQTNCA